MASMDVAPALVGVPASVQVQFPVPAPAPAGVPAPAQAQTPFATAPKQPVSYARVGAGARFSSPRAEERTHGVSDATLREIEKKARPSFSVTLYAPRSTLEHYPSPVTAQQILREVMSFFATTGSRPPYASVFQRHIVVSFFDKERADRALAELTAAEIAIDGYRVLAAEGAGVPQPAKGPARLWRSVRLYNVPAHLTEDGLALALNDVPGVRVEKCALNVHQEYTNVCNATAYALLELSDSYREGEGNRKLPTHLLIGRTRVRIAVRDGSAGDRQRAAPARTAGLLPSLTDAETAPLATALAAAEAAVVVPDPAPARQVARAIDPAAMAAAATDAAPSVAAQRPTPSAPRKAGEAGPAPGRQLTLDGFTRAAAARDGEEEPVRHSKMRKTDRVAAAARPTSPVGTGGRFAALAEERMEATEAANGDVLEVEMGTDADYVDANFAKGAEPIDDGAGVGN